MTVQGGAGGVGGPHAGGVAGSYVHQAGGIGFSYAYQRDHLIMDIETQPFERMGGVLRNYQDDALRDAFTYRGIGGSGATNDPERYNFVRLLNIGRFLINQTIEQQADAEEVISTGQIASNFAALLELNTHLEHLESMIDVFEERCLADIPDLSQLPSVATRLYSHLKDTLYAVVQGIGDLAARLEMTPPYHTAASETPHEYVGLEDLIETVIQVAQDQEDRVINRAVQEEFDAADDLALAGGS